MPDYRREFSLSVSADVAFRYLSDPTNLPAYVATMALAEPATDERLRVAADVQGRHEEGEAAYRVDAAARRIEWGSSGDQGYRGDLQVAGGDAATVAIHLRTDSGEDADEINRVLDETVANIKSQVRPG